MGYIYIYIYIYTHIYTGGAHAVRDWDLGVHSCASIKGLPGALSLRVSRPLHHALSLLVCVSDFFLEGFSLGGKNGTHTGCEKNLLKKKYFGGLQICLYD